MRISRLICCVFLVLALSVSAFSAFAAFDSQKDDIKSICDFAVEYVNSASTEVFTEFMSEKIEELFDDGDSHSDKFVYLFEQDPELLDKENNQLSKTVAVIGDIYVNGGTAKLTQSDINKNVIPGYGVDDYESDDAKEFMEIINEYEAKLTPAAEEPAESGEDDAMPPEKNKESDDKEKTSKSGGASVGTVILVSILVSAIMFVAGTYALRQSEAKGRSEAGNNIDDDDVFNLRLAVKSMQTSLQKADGNFKELDKLRIQVDEIDEKLEHITEYLRKLNKGE